MSDEWAAAIRHSTSRTNETGAFTGMHSDSSHTPNLSVPAIVFAPGEEAVSVTGTVLRFGEKLALVNLSDENDTPAGAASGLKDVGYFSLQ